jgi:vacuolar-type H+-ATPase subunit H
MTALLTVALIVVVILWLQSKKNLAETTAKWQHEVAQLKAEATKEKTGLEQRLNELQKQNQVLSKYQAIVDAEATAATLLSNARQEAAQILTSAKEARATTTRETQALKDKAQGVLNTAMQEAQQIREEAHKRAEAIAGDAWKALQNAESLEKTVQAMKNVIEGYGNKYIIPTYTFAGRTG